MTLQSQPMAINQSSFYTLSTRSSEAPEVLAQRTNIRALVDDPHLLASRYALATHEQQTVSQDRMFKRMCLPIYSKGIGHFATSLHGQEEHENLHTALAIHATQNRGDGQKVLLVSWEDLLEVAFTYRTMTGNPFSLSMALYALSENILKPNPEFALNAKTGAFPVTVIVSLFESARLLNPSLVREIPNSLELKKLSLSAHDKLQSIEQNLRNLPHSISWSELMDQCLKLASDETGAQFLKQILAFLTLSNSTHWQSHQHSFMTLMLASTDFFGAWSRSNWGLVSIQRDTLGERESFCYHFPAWTSEHGTFESDEMIRGGFNPYAGPPSNNFVENLLKLSNDFGRSVA